MKMKRRERSGAAMALLVAWFGQLSGCASKSNHGTPLGDERFHASGGSATPGGDGNAAGDEAAVATPIYAAPVEEGALSSKNSIGRTGAFYLPEGYNERALPLVVAYHGTGGSGLDMVAAFRALAAANEFLIVAPDSGRSPAGDLTWEVGTSAGEVTQDYMHTLQCIAEVRAKSGVIIDDMRALAVGFSGGGSSAPYIATNEVLFHAYAVLHGGVFAGGIGTNIIAGWFSTGQDDTLRPPDLVQESVDYMAGLGFSDVTFRTYPGGHSLSAQELGDVINWWLKR